MKNLSDDLLPELKGLTTKWANGLRKKWRQVRADRSRIRHKKFCLLAAKRFNVDPRTISFVLLNKDWRDSIRFDIQNGISRSKRLWTVRKDLDPDSLIRNKSLYIGHDRWRSLNEQYTRSEIKQAMLEAVRKHNVPPPYQNITRNYADYAWQRLCEEPTRDLVVRMKDVVTRWDYEYEMSDWVLTAGNLGNEASNFYHQKARWACGYLKIPSPERSWNEDDLFLTTVNALWTLKLSKVDNTALRAVIALRRYIASQFKPLAAKTLYEVLNARHVYDPSMGWGDRLTGFLASEHGKSYCGTDPNTRLTEGYHAQVQRYNNRRKRKVSIYAQGSEIKGGIWKHGHRVDTVFTSPPYFNAERYSEEETQSWVKFDNEEAWLRGFMYPTVRNCWKMLRGSKHFPERGGILAMNISDIAGQKLESRVRICDPMNDYIGTLPDARYLGTIGLRLTKRPQSGRYEGKDSTVVVEPIWIWAKGGSWTLEDLIKNGWQ